MTPDQYWARIRAIPLLAVRDSSDGDAVICRQPHTQDTVSVTKPEFYKDDNEMEATLRFYEQMYSSQLN